MDQKRDECVGMTGRKRVYKGGKEGAEYKGEGGLEENGQRYGWWS